MTEAAAGNRIHDGYIKLSRELAESEEQKHELAKQVEELVGEREILEKELQSAKEIQSRLSKSVGYFETAEKELSRENEFLHEANQRLEDKTKKLENDLQAIKTQHRQLSREYAQTLSLMEAEKTESALRMQQMQTKDAANQRLDLQVAKLERELRNTSDAWRIDREARIETQGKLASTLESTQDLEVVLQKSAAAKDLLESLLQERDDQLKELEKSFRISEQNHEIARKDVEHVTKQILAYATEPSTRNSSIQVSPKTLTMRWSRAGTRHSPLKSLFRSRAQHIPPPPASETGDSSSTDASQNIYRYSDWAVDEDLSPRQSRLAHNAISLADELARAEESLAPSPEESKTQPQLPEYISKVVDDALDNQVSGVVLPSTLTSATGSIVATTENDSTKASVAHEKSESHHPPLHPAKRDEDVLPISDRGDSRYQVLSRGEMDIKIDQAGPEHWFSAGEGATMHNAVDDIIRRSSPHIVEGRSMATPIMPTVDLAVRKQRSSTDAAELSKDRIHALGLQFRHAPSETMLLSSSIPSLQQMGARRLFTRFSIGPVAMSIGFSMLMVFLVESTMTTYRYGRSSRYGAFGVPGAPIDTCFTRLWASFLLWLRGYLGNPRSEFYHVL